MIDYLRSGGLPEFVNLRGEETKRHYVEAVKDTILLKDIVERHKIKDAALLDRIFASSTESGGYPPTQNGDIRSLFWLFSLMALQN